MSMNDVWTGLLITFLALCSVVAIVFMVVGFGHLVVWAWDL